MPKKNPTNTLRRAGLRPALHLPLALALCLCAQQPQPACAGALAATASETKPAAQSSGKADAAGSADVWEDFLLNEYGLDRDLSGGSVEQNVQHQLSASADTEILTRRELLTAERKMLDGEYEQALTHYSSALQASPANPYIQLGKARALLALRMNSDAVKLLDNIQRDFPKLPEACLLRGQVLESEEKNEEAAKVYRAGLSQHPMQLELLEAAANLATKLDDLDGAIEYYSRITEIDGNHIFAYYILGRFYIQKANLLAEQWRANADNDKQRGEYLRKAAENFENALDLKDDIVDFYKFLGQVYEQLSQPDKAHETYARGLTRFPSSREFQALFEVSLGPEMQEQDKLKAYEDLVQNNGDNFALKELYAKVAEEKFKRTDLALKMYRQMIESDTTQLEPYIKLGELQLRAGQISDAVETLEHANLLDENNFKVQSDLAEAYAKNKQYKQAADLYQQLLEQNPQQNAFYDNLFNCYQALGDSAGAIEVLNKLAAQFGENEQIYLLQGDLFFDTGRLDEAQSVFEKALALNDKNEAVYHVLLTIYLYKERKEKIEWLVAKGAKVFAAEPAKFLKVQGQAYFDAHRFDEAAKYFEQVLHSSKPDAELLQKLAVCYQRTKHPEKGGELIELAIKSIENPVLREAACAEIYQELEKFNEAADHFRQALTALASDPAQQADEKLRMRIEFALLQISAEMKKKDAVREQIAQLKAKYFASHAEALIKWSFNACRLTGEFELFERLAEEALAQNGSNQAEIYFFLGSMQFEHGNAEKAEASYKKSLELNPRDADTLNALGYMFAEKGVRLDEARKLLEQAYQLNPLAGHIVDSLGWLYYQEGEFQKSAQYLEQAAMLSVPDSVIYEHLGYAYNRLGETERAITYWTRSIELDAKDSAGLKVKIQEAQASLLNDVKQQRTGAAHSDQ